MIKKCVEQKINMSNKEFTPHIKHLTPEAKATMFIHRCLLKCDLHHRTFSSHYLEQGRYTVGKMALSEYI